MSACRRFTNARRGRHNRRASITMVPRNPVDTAVAAFEAVRAPTGEKEMFVPRECEKRADLRLARQPTVDVDAQCRVIAYELLFCSGFENHAVITDGARSTRSVLARSMTRFGLQKTAAAKDSLFNCTEEVLRPPYLRLSPLGGSYSRCRKAASAPPNGRSTIRRVRKWPSPLHERRSFWQRRRTVLAESVPGYGFLGAGSVPSTQEGEQKKRRYAGRR